MNLRSVSILILSISTGLWGCQRDIVRAVDDSSFVLVGGNLVDSRGRLFDGPAMIWIEDGRIAYIGTSDEIVLPDSLDHIDISGKWVVPGLMDLHIHPPSVPNQNEVMQTLLAFGVTTVRVAASTDESGIELREQIREGEIIGPTILTAGRLIDAPNSVHSTAAEVSTPDEIRVEVARQASEGVDYIKLYVGLDSDLVEAAVGEAHRHGLRVLGHLGNTSWGDAARAGIDALTHSGFIGPMWELVPTELHPDNLTNGQRNSGIGRIRSWIDLVTIPGPDLDALAMNLLQNNVEVNPNLVLTWAMIYGSEPDSIRRFHPEFGAADRARRWTGRPHPFSQALGDYPIELADSLYQTFASVISKIESSGVRITTGTDLGVPWMTPGIALHEELQFLSDAGLTPVGVLAAATINGAESLGLSSTGQLRENWEADLIVISGDPLQDVRSLRQIEMVIKDGVAYYPSNLTAKAKDVQR